ncbi:MAG TPA: hypothetical protein VHP35_14345 [Terriglobia bacterium]|jgi:hypothetical protein|nr:hypothetical protein [Terriglobia bacterium]
MKRHFSPFASIRVDLRFVFMLGLGAMAWGQGSSSDISTHTFDPKQIQISLNPDLDIVYHTLAHFAVPGDPSNLHSKAYVDEIQQAKKDLEVGQTKLDQSRAVLEQSYRKLPGLRFLNLAPFMADDYASFKQALAMIDFNFRNEAEDSRDTYEQRKAREALAPLLFGNTRRLIPLFKNRFPQPAEHAFLKQFAECMDDERDHFYKSYREARTEVDQASRERFEQLWKSEGSRILGPWASRSGVNVFNIYLCPVMKRNGRGVPVNQEQRVLFHVVAPLPETKAESMQSLFVVLHETTHRLTDRLVDSAATIPDSQKAVTRENAAFFADHVFLKARHPQYHETYLKFFLSLDQSNLPGAAVEKEFLKSYPVEASLQSALDQLVKSLH